MNSPKGAREKLVKKKHLISSLLEIILYKHQEHLIKNEFW